MIRAKRYLRWYDKRSDVAIGEEALEALELSELQALFGVSVDNPMVECWPVGDRQAKVLEATVRHRIDLAAFDYFVEADAQ